MWVCSKCKSNNYDNADYCSRCGTAKFATKTNRDTKQLAFIFSAVLVVLVIITGLILNSSKKPEAVSQTQIVTVYITPAPTPAPTSAPIPTPTPTPLYGTEYTGSVSGFSEKYFSSASASSELHEGDITFVARYAIDAGIHRPWVDGVRGTGSGETLTLRFNKTETISILSFSLGYARSHQYYDINNRPSTMIISFSDGSSFEYSFRDTMQDQLLKLSKPVNTEWVKLTLGDVYSGTLCDDTCIYLVKAYG